MSEATVDVADLRPHGRGEDADAGTDAPLRDDIRLLGRVLGEVIAEQSGAEVLELVEQTRVAAFGVRRSDVDRAELAGRGVDITPVQQLGPEGSVGSRFAFFADPDGNGWAVQEIRRG